MAEIKMESELSAGTPMAQEDNCEGTCTHVQVQSADREEMSLAVLVAMVPLLVFTLFGQVGLL